MALNPTNHRTTKHITMRYHAIRERIENGEIMVDWVSTEAQKADILTKALHNAKHTSHFEKLVFCKV